MGDFQKFQQVRHLLNINLFFHIARHGGHIGNIHLLDVLALNDVFFPVFVTQCATAATMARDLASGYCREIGFSDPTTVPSDLRACIVMRAARLAAIPLAYVSESTDGASQTDRFAGG